jgi:hypothetical protein
VVAAAVVVVVVAAAADTAGVAGTRINLKHNEEPSPVRRFLAFKPP